MSKKQPRRPSLRTPKKTGNFKHSIWRFFLLLLFLNTGWVVFFYGPQWAETCRIFFDKICCIRELQVTGLQKTSLKEVCCETGLHNGLPLRMVDVAKTQRILAKMPWVAHASVKRLWPFKIKIQVMERSPFALWQNNGEHFLLDNKGTIIPVTPPLESGLILLVGEKAPLLGPNFLKTLKAHCPDLLKRLNTAHLMPSGRWDLYISDTKNIEQILRLQLPERNIEKALRAFMFLESKHVSLKAVKNIDLRVPGRALLLHHPIAKQRTS